MKSKPNYSEVITMDKVVDLRTLTKLFRMALNDSGKTQRQVAEELGLDESAISQAKTYDPDHPRRFLQVQTRVLHHLEGVDVEGPLYTIS